MNAALRRYLTDFSTDLHPVNPSTGAVTMIEPSAMPPDPNVPFTINPDGTTNLCDEILYGVGGKLSASFDSVTADSTTLTVVSAVVPPNLWRINPSTGVATLIGLTDLNLDGGVELNGEFYAFSLGFPTQSVTLDLTSGSTAFLRNFDPPAGLVLGAAPTPEPGTRSATSTL